MKLPVAAYSTEVVTSATKAGRYGVFSEGESTGSSGGHSAGLYDFNRREDGNRLAQRASIEGVHSSWYLLSRKAGWPGRLRLRAHNEQHPSI